MEPTGMRRHRLIADQPVRAQLLGNNSVNTPTFLARAERAFRRVARKLRSENHALGLPAVVWRDRKPRGERLARYHMDLKMRRALAREPFEAKIRKVAQLLQLSAKVKKRTADDSCYRAAVSESILARGWKSPKEDSICKEP